MTNPVNQALLSTDENLVKNVRKGYKSRVTRTVTSLTKILVKRIDDASKFDIENISPEEVQEKYKELTEARDIVENLHIKCMTLRAVGIDD